MELRPGDHVTPNTRLVRPLDEGAMGKVWVGEHIGLGAEVAVKLISPELMRKHPTLRDRFEQEAALAARIDSLHVVKIFDHGVTAGGTPYIVMELLKGSNLAEWLALLEVLELGEARVVVTQVASALKRAHELGIVHRDIKPHNLFLVDSDYDMFVKVLDFGVAKLTSGEGTRFSTAQGVLVGTVEYMSPEQVRDPKDVDHRADLWSLAVVAYQGLTGRLPFAGESQYKLFDAICSGEHVPPSELRDDVPPALDEWFARAFDPEVAKRFQTASALADAFCVALEEKIDSAPWSRGQPSPISGRDGPTSAERTSRRRARGGDGPKSARVDTKPATPLLDSSDTPPEWLAPTVPGAPPTSADQKRAPTSASGATRTLPGVAERRRLREGLAISAAALLVALGVAYFTTTHRPGRARAGLRGLVGSVRLPRPTPPSATASAIGEPAPAMLAVPAGSYQIGCTSDGPRCFEDEKPAHQVALRRYGIMQHEVTVTQYLECVERGRCPRPAADEGCTWQAEGHERHPVTCVPWQAGRAYCAFRGWRLPTEAEWEVAARGPKLGDYPWGEDQPSCARTVMASASGAGCGTGDALPVGSLPADRSWIGALDMGGNAREWTAGDYAAYPGGSVDEESRGKVSRGGSWRMSDRELLTSHTRGVDEPDTARNDIGFRCAVDLD